MKIYYTKKEYEELLSHIVILVDTQEKSNKEVIDWLCANNIKYKYKSLKTGDYGLMIESCPDLGFPSDTYFRYDFSAAILWFTELFVFDDNETDSIVSVLEILETMDEEGVVISENEFSNMITALTSNTEYIPVN